MPDLLDPERRIALAYTPAAVRDALGTLFALDEKLAGIVARTTEPAIGLMRLVWWRDALDALDRGPPPAEPLLIAASALREQGIDGPAMAAMTAGWEPLLDDPDLGVDAVEAHAKERGARLFRLAAILLGDASAPGIDAGGDGWARVDLARHTADPAVSDRIIRSASFATVPPRWPRTLRPLGQLAALARHDVKRGSARLGRPASPSRLVRILAFHSFGR